MAVVISMLRGVNVGGHKLLKMDALRALYESLGLKEPQTYVQSGNVVFKTKDRDLTLLAKKIETGIEETFAMHSDVILRTPAELRNVIARNPFGGRDGIGPKKLLVNFLASDPGPEAREKVLSIKADPDELQMEGRDLYIYFPNGMGHSKLPWAVIDRALKTRGTARNWNSVAKLLEIAEKLEQT
jgi:uncharacterized protein (DUF1697 family)